MKFDDSKLYSYDQADDSLIGCKGYFGSALVVIKRTVENEDSKWFGTVKEINKEDFICRYKNEIGSFFYFYKVD